MKKTLSILLAAMLIFTFVLTGCSGSDDKKDKDKDKDTKSGDATIVAGDNVKWPGNKMGGIEKPDAKITAVVKDDKTGNYTVAFSDMSKDSAQQYIDKLKALGYKSIMEVNDTDGILYSGQNSEGVLATFTYNYTAKEGTVAYLPKPDGITNPTGDSDPDSSSEIDMTDASPWPQDFLAGVPELNGKITNVSNQNDENISVDLEYVEKADFEAFISALKKNGYTVDADELKDTSSYEYTAYNAKGDRLIAQMTYEYKRANVYLEKAVEQ